MQQYLDIPDKGKIRKDHIRSILKISTEQGGDLKTEYPSIEISYLDGNDKTVISYSSYHKREEVYKSIVSQLEKNNAI